MSHGCKDRGKTQSVFVQRKYVDPMSRLWDLGFASVSGDPSSIPSVVLLGSQPVSVPVKRQSHTSSDDPGVFYIILNSVSSFNPLPPSLVSCWRGVSFRVRFALPKICNSGFLLKDFKQKMDSHWSRMKALRLSSFFPAVQWSMTPGL